MAYSKSKSTGRKLNDTDGREPPFHYDLSDYVVKRISFDQWDIIHAGAIVATVGRDTAMRFICGQIDPAKLGSDAEAKDSTTAENA